MRRPGLPPDPPELNRVRVVLVRPRGSANIGAAARAMKNMGLHDLALVGSAVQLRAAETMAVHARDVLRGARVADTIEEAVADCGMVVGTTSRGGTYRARAARPEVLAPELLAHAAHGPVALLFGPEDHGLSNEDLRHCPRLLTIETSPAYPSLNLAQAVLLVCYELRRAALPAVVSDVVPASAAAVGRMFDHLQAALLRIGFLNAQNPDHIMFALRQLFGRTTLADHEVRILLGLARQIDWAAKTNGVTGDRVPVTGCAEPSAADGGESDRNVSASGVTREPGADRSPLTGHRHASPPMADIISFAEVVRLRRRARERATTEACVQLLEANLHYALHLFATAHGVEREIRARQIRQLGELLEYVTRAL